MPENQESINGTSACGHGKRWGKDSEYQHIWLAAVVHNAISKALALPKNYKGKDAAINLANKLVKDIEVAMRNEKVIIDRKRPEPFMLVPGRVPQ